MKKLIFTVATILTATFGVKAQNQVGASVGLFQVGEESISFNLMGLSAFGKHELNDNLRIGANVGYYSKEVFPGISLISMPIMGLIEYKRNINKLTSFGGLEVGINRLGASGDGQTDATNNLAFAPVVGFEYELSKQLDVVLNAKYNYIMTEGNATKGLGLNVGVAYKL
jgi:hypothetical protein